MTDINRYRSSLRARGVPEASISEWSEALVFERKRLAKALAAAEAGEAPDEEEVDEEESEDDAEEDED